MLALRRAAADTAPRPTTEVAAALCWLSAAPLRVGQQVLVKHGTAVVRALVQEVAGRLDLDTLRLDPAETLGLNDIGQVRLHLAAPLPVEPYAVYRRTGAFLVIDPHDGATLAAGMVRGGDEA